MERVHSFEDECKRLQIHSVNLKIQTLRFFVFSPAKNWYETNLKKFGLLVFW